MPYLSHAANLLVAPAKAGMAMKQTETQRQPRLTKDQKIRPA
jgi:hypothetical protein